MNFQALQDKLIVLGQKCQQNKYLGAVARSFTRFMPLTICGAMAVLWTSVLVNAKTGLGALWPPIMGLQFLNPVFSAISFCTTDCIALYVTFSIGAELANENGENRTFGGLVAVASMLVVSMTAQTIATGADTSVTIKGIFSDSLGSNGLFTGMIMAILSAELYHLIAKAKWSKINMPEQVPPNIAESFNNMIPAFLTLTVMSGFGRLIFSLTGLYVNELIKTYIQAPLVNVGGSLGGRLIFTLLACAFWSIGLHGENMINGVANPIFSALSNENMSLVAAGQAPIHVINGPFNRLFSCTGGTGMVLGLTIAILLFAKRDENKTIGRLALVPNLFNIGEINMFGLPVVLNPILIIPFIITPIVTTIIGYVLTVVGFCPIACYSVPWTMPLFLYGLVATGSIMGGITQLICVAVSVLIYAPFVIMLEKQQAAQAEAETK